jgi:hypothetical protein
VAASAALTANLGPVGFAARPAAAALIDFPDELANDFDDFGTTPETRALVDFPDATEEDLDTMAEPEALGASRLG